MSLKLDSDASSHKMKLYGQVDGFEPEIEPQGQDQNQYNINTTATAGFSSDAPLLHAAPAQEAME